MLRLGVNIDHVATLRNVRGTCYPSVIEAALVAESNGADLITLHLREDRRHICDDDVYLMRKILKTAMNLEIALTAEMLEIAVQIKPDYVCIVPEKRHELTTEGGLDVRSNAGEIAAAVYELQRHGINTSLFIDPDLEQINAALTSGCYAIELHTGKYADTRDLLLQQLELKKIIEASNLAHAGGLVVNAGHGLNYHNVMPIAMITPIHELNIGHAIIAQSIFCGLGQAVKEMKQLLWKARQC
jgi:pyridoxine 5-phosphate synthase